MPDAVALQYKEMRDEFLACLEDCRFLSLDIIARPQSLVDGRSAGWQLVHTAMRSAASCGASWGTLSNTAELGMGSMTERH